MSEKQETIADILAEMRGGPIPQHRHDRVLLRNYADRLEAAYKREREGWEGAACSVISDAFQSSKIAVVNEPVGNYAKMLEALEHVEKIAREFACGNYYISDFPKMLFDAIRPALAAPPRNCDRFMRLEDALAAWREVSPAESGPFDEWLFADVKGESK